MNFILKFFRFSLRYYYFTSSFNYKGYEFISISFITFNRKKDVIFFTLELLKEIPEKKILLIFLSMFGK